MTKRSGTMLLVLAGILLLPLGSAHATSVVVSVPESYAEVTAGERVYFQTDILYPENVGRHDFKIGYQIKNESGKVVSASQFYKAIETQASFTDFADIPKG